MSVNSLTISLDYLADVASRKPADAAELVGGGDVWDGAVLGVGVKLVGEGV